jgi:hypothetical protein
MGLLFFGEGALLLCMHNRLGAKERKDDGVSSQHTCAVGSKTQQSKLSWHDHQVCCHNSFSSENHKTTKTLADESYPQQPAAPLAASQQIVSYQLSTMAPSLTSNTHADSNVAISILPPPVLLTPRPMTDEELAMPMTAAPTNEGTSEVSSLASSDSSAPSERVWSRLARILSLRRAHLSDDLIGRMMYVK